MGFLEHANGHFNLPTSTKAQNQQLFQSPAKRRFQTRKKANTNSPVKNGVDEFHDSTLDNANWTPLDPTAHVNKGPKEGPSKFVKRLTTPELPPSLRYDTAPPGLQNDAPRYSLSTTSTYLYDKPDSGPEVSFI